MGSMKELTSTRIEPLDFLLRCDFANNEDITEKLKGVKSIAKDRLVIVGNELYMIEEPTYSQDGKESRPTLYFLGRASA